MRLAPFRALRPPAPFARDVAAVPYDTVDTQEAKALAAGNDRSFLHVEKSEIDFPEGSDIYAPEVYARAAVNLARLEADGALIRESEPRFYVYRQQMGGHAQHGVVGCCHIEDYERDVIRKHEKTRDDKEQDRTRHVDALGANAGPVFLAFRDVPAIDELIRRAEQAPPVFDFTSVDGVQHSAWKVEATAECVQAFDKVPVCYIADGHHRASAAVNVGRARRKANPGHTGAEEYNRFLGVLFPASQLRILPINRCVLGFNGLSQEAFLRRVRQSFAVTPHASAEPPSPGHVSMYLGGAWWGLSWASEPAGDPVSGLDVSVLQDRLFDPILGIKDPRRDERIEFVGGIRGTEDLVARVRAGRAAAAFSMFPVTMGEVMAIADAGRIMPPKSTWFEPKLRSGLFVHTF